MAEGTRSEQVENEVRTQIPMTIQEVGTKFLSWIESLECRLCNSLKISLKDGVDELRKEL